MSEAELIPFLQRLTSRLQELQPRTLPMKANCSKCPHPRTVYAVALQCWSAAAKIPDDHPTRDTLNNWICNVVDYAQGKRECMPETPDELWALLGTQPASVPATKIDSPHKTAKEAAAYLHIPYSRFRKVATKIKRQPQTGRYRIEDLDDYAASQRPRAKR